MLSLERDTSRCATSRSTSRFEVERGCLAIAGPSGAGKSTILRVCAGLVRPAARPSRVRRRRPGSTPSAASWVEPEDRVVRLPVPGLRAVPAHDARGRTSPTGCAACRAARAAARGARSCSSASASRRWPTRIRARCRAESASASRSRARSRRRPRVLLLDEPLAALDARTRAAAARELAAALREAAVPALLVTHDFADAAQLGDEVAIVDRGRLLQRGRASDLAAAPASVLRGRLRRRERAGRRRRARRPAG